MKISSKLRCELSKNVMSGWAKSAIIEVAATLTKLGDHASIDKIAFFCIDFVSIRKDRLFVAIILF